jgi:hypothetical protein
MTYTSLVTDVESYLIRIDAALVAQIPRFIMQAENISRLDRARYRNQRTGTIPFHSITPTYREIELKFFRDRMSIAATTGRIKR